MTVVERAEHSSPRAERADRPELAAPEAAPDLRVYSAEERLARSQRRQARVLLAMSAGIVAVAFLIVAAANIVVTSRQFRVDNLSSAVSAAVVQNQDLQLQRSQLESPQRIISIAEHRLGMITPKSVTYLPAQPLPRATASTKSGTSHHATTRPPAAGKHGVSPSGRRAPTR